MPDQLTAEDIAAMIRSRQSNVMDLLMPSQQEARSIEPTFRQSLYEKLQNAAQDHGASSNFSRAIADTGVGQNIGLADLIPGLNVAMYADQGLHDFKDGANNLDAGQVGQAYLHGLKGSLSFLPTTMLTKAIVTSPIMGALGRHMQAIRAAFGGSVK